MAAGRVTHLLVTNDFPPKVGGIQAYLWELWRRLDPDSFVVLTASSHPDAAAFDRSQAERGIRIERVPGRVLVPTPRLARRDPGHGPPGRGRAWWCSTPPSRSAWSAPGSASPTPCCSTGPRWPSPGRLPAGRQLVAHVLRHSALAISAGGYPAAEAAAGRSPGRGMPPVVEIPPGSTSSGSGPSAPTSGPGPGPISACPPTDRWW